MGQSIGNSPTPSRMRRFITWPSPVRSLICGQHTGGLDGLPTCLMLVTVKVNMASNQAPSDKKLHEPDLCVVNQLELHFDPLDLCRGRRHQCVWLRWFCVCCRTNDDCPFSPC